MHIHCQLAENNGMTGYTAYVASSTNQFSLFLSFFFSYIRSFLLFIEGCRVSSLRENEAVQTFLSTFLSSLLQGREICSQVSLHCPVRLKLPVQLLPPSYFRPLLSVQLLNRRFHVFANDYVNLIILVHESDRRSKTGPKCPSSVI